MTGRQRHKNLQTEKHRQTERKTERKSGGKTERKAVKEKKYMVFLKKVLHKCEEKLQEKMKMA